MSESLIASTSPASNTAYNASSTGKIFHLQVTNTCKNPDFAAKHSCKRNNHHICTNLHQLDSNKLLIKCPCSQLPPNATSTSINKIVSNKSNPAIHTHSDDAIDVDHATKKQQQRHSICSIESVNRDAYQRCALKRSTDSSLSEINTNVTDVSVPETDDCDLSLNRSSCECSILADNSFVSLDDSIVSSNLFDLKTDDGSMAAEKKISSSLLSVNSLSVCGSSGSSCGNNNSNNSTVVAGNSPLMISLSKSETNIFDEKADGTRLEIFNVVSLNDLNDTEIYFSRPMNDLSKTQCLTKISDQDVHSNKQHRMKLASSSGTTIASMASKDISDKIF